MPGSSTPLNLLLDVLHLQLPPELWEDILLRLHPSEIPRFRLLSRNFLSLVSGSPELQYQLDLYAAGLEDGPRDASFSLPERRKQLDQYLSGWSNAASVQHSHVTVPGDFLAYDIIEDCGGGVLAHAREGPGGEIHFTRLPSPSKGITTKQWHIHNLPAQEFLLATDPELDLLVIIEYVVDLPNALHFLRLSDGKPHSDAFSPIVSLESLQFYPESLYSGSLSVQTGVRMLLVLYRDGGDIAHGITLDWRTGNRGKPWICPYHPGQMTPTLVDDHRILTTLTDGDTGTDLLALLDTTFISEDTQLPTGITFELGGVAFFCECDHSSLARIPPHRGPFCLDHSRQIPVVVPIMFPDKGNSEVADLYIITSGQICALAEKIEARPTQIPWEEWKDSLTLVGKHLPRTHHAYSLNGLNLFVNMGFIPADVDPSFLLRVYRCSPGVRRGCPSEATEDFGLPYGFFELVFEDLRYQDSEIAEGVEFCEDNIIVHSRTVETGGTNVHFLSV